MLSSPRRVSGVVGTTARRWMSANEAAVALRPFYFAVHPDRFATNPDVREKNEKSLQIFNGYLNDLFPMTPQLSSHRPIQIAFSIVDKTGGDGKLRNVNINLVGTDPVGIIRNALESCRLDTAHIPRTTSVTPSPAARPPPSSHSSPDMASAHFWGEYMKRTRRHQDAASILRKKRDEALQKAQKFQKTHVTLKEEIEDLKWRTGCKEVVWQMEWAESHLRRCLSALHRLLDQIPKAEREAIVGILLKNTIRFGRGSFICCDGSVQFGADNVPEQWQQVCTEASVRRSQQLAQLEEAKRSVGEALGGAEILLPPNKGLAQTLQQLQTLIVRIASRPMALRQRVGRLAKETMVEVVTSYDELAVGNDGRLLVPCNVDIPSLASFLEESAPQSRAVNEEAQRTAGELRRAKANTVSFLRLSDLDWEDCLPRLDVLNAINRLQSAQESLVESLKDLHVRFSANPNIHIRPDGKVSLPVDWS